ncbi:hypothetical protein LXA43DRAFT_975391 [Ganoderma leucocontextum]|nr:hypothetical protein LXA43DRAFT_975391 [Ganoderma leucocontextum]
MSFRTAFTRSPQWHCAMHSAFRPRFAVRKVSSHVSGSPVLDAGLPLLSSTVHTHSSPNLKAEDPVESNAPNRKSEGPGELSDQEWEIRTGRAIYILQQTLPGFFSTGLITSLDTSGGSEKGEDGEELSIYSPSIRLEYRPPTSFPPPFPRTAHVEGLPLYMASSVFVRHTLSALYTDLRVELQRITVHGPRSASGLCSTDSAEPGVSGDLRRSQQGEIRSIRQKSLFIGLMVHGTNRVSKAQGGWQVNSTYTFSPTTGLIRLHVVNSIHPAPHQAFFNALRAALNKIGLGGAQGAGEGGMARTTPSSPPQSSRTGTHPS